ncbi:MAG: hypothetical protein ACR2QB_00695 [Gammaproteobacteria bacterium]
MSIIFKTCSHISRPTSPSGIYAAAAFETTVIIGFCLLLSTFSLA